VTSDDKLPPPAKLGVKNKRPKLSSFEKEQLAKGFGVKADSHKARMDLIPPEVMFGYGRALAVGSSKYNDRNWENGMSWHRMFAAAMRHLWAFWAGQDNDEESRLHHLESAIFSVCALYTYSKRGIGEDNRKRLPKEQIEAMLAAWKSIEEAE